MDELIPVSHHSRRWYDAVPRLSHAVSVTQALPQGVRDLIARRLSDYIDAHRDLSRKNKHALSLGTSQVMGMYRASNRRRWYDAEYAMHRAYTMMGAMPVWFLEDFAGKILEMATLVAEEQRRAGVEGLWWGGENTQIDLHDRMMNSVISLVEDRHSIRLSPEYTEPNEFEMLPELHPEPAPKKRRAVFGTPSHRHSRSR